MAFLTRRVVGLIGLACASALWLYSPAAAAQSEATLESEVKAAFLYNFSKYVEYPPSAFTGDDAKTFRICVLADPTFVKAVDAIIAGETIDGRTVTRQIPDSAGAARACNILFVGRGEMDRAQQLLAAVERAPVLTVGDAADFLKRGGAIAFIRDGDRVRFDVNVAEAQRGGLEISSRLLRVAHRVSAKH
jgi:hypothetical protein